MNKYLKYLGCIAIISIAITIGIFLGMKVEKYSEEQANGNLSNSTKIALVNLDEGVTYQGEQRNFTNEILGSEVEQYTFTGLEDAKSGTKDGRYSSYVIIPSDFSKNVVSINTAPSKSLLKYEISGNLTNTASDKAWQNVMKLKEKLNDDVGYMYISSILNEFHDGQVNALKVLSNDSKDKDVIMAISNLDLVATLDLREVERLQNNIEDLDINPDIEENKKIIEAIDVAYKTYLSETSDELGALKTDSTALNADNDNVETAGNNIRNLENDDGSANYSTNNTINFLSAYNSSVSTDLSKLLSNIDTKVQNQSTNNANFTKNKTSELDTLVNGLQKNHVDSETSQYKNIKIQVTSIIDDFLKSKVFDWSDFTELNNLLEKQKDIELVDNATQYLDKSIIKGFSEFDYTVPNLNFDTIVTSLENNVQNDTKLKQSLVVYAKSIGKDEKETEKYTINDYLSNNNDILLDFPEIDSTEKVDQLLKDSEIALTTDSKTLLENTTDTIHDSINLYVDNIASTDIKQNSSAAINNYKDGLKNVPTTGLDDLKVIANGITPIANNDLVNQVKNDLNPLMIEQKQNKKILLDAIQGHKISNNLFHDQFLLYDPLQSIDADEIENYVKEYEKNNTSTKYKIENKNREYTAFVSESYSNANEQVNSMKEDIRKYQTLSDEKITTGLENAKSIKKETSSSNNGLMSNYINKLPYTKNGTVANTTVYDFITASTDMEGNKVESSSQNIGTNLFTGIAIATIIITLFWIFAFLVIKRKKKIN